MAQQCSHGACSSKYNNGCCEGIRHCCSMIRKHHAHVALIKLKREAHCLNGEKSTISFASNNFYLRSWKVIKKLPYEWNLTTMVPDQQIKYPFTRITKYLKCMSGVSRCSTI